MLSGVYGIRNLLDGKIYVGSSVRISSRLKEHRNMLCGIGLTRGNELFGELQ